MSDPRILGLTLMAIAVAAFLGSTSEALPPVTFFPALVLFAIGAFKFLRTNHQAMATSEERIKRSVNPTIRENRMARTLADRQAESRAMGLPPSRDDANVESEPMPAFATELHAIELDHYDEGEDVAVTADVSFPVEIQSGDALADQLAKLNRLLAQGVLTEEEYAIAKSKLLA